MNTHNLNNNYTHNFNNNMFLKAVAIFPAVNKKLLGAIFPDPVKESPGAILLDLFK